MARAQDAAGLTGADQVGAATVFVWSKMICRARCYGYNWVTKRPPLREWAKGCYDDEWVIGERVMSETNNGQ